MKSSSAPAPQLVKPMLAATLPPDQDLTALPYPLLVSPKLDGVRAMVQNGHVYSRSGKLIPNQYVQKLFGRKALNGLDGELIVGAPSGEGVFKRTSSAVISASGEPDVRFYVLDWFGTWASASFYLRMPLLQRAVKSGTAKNGVVILPQVKVAGLGDLLNQEREYLRAGYEGAMLRTLNAPYKQGRSTLREFYLVKLKRFSDGEALVLSAVELQHNENDCIPGTKRRRSCKAGKSGAGKLGALRVRDLKTGVEFEVGTGFTDAERRAIWNSGIPDNCVIKYKYFAYGVDKKPRHPVFLGFRSKEDM